MPRRVEDPSGLHTSLVTRSAARSAGNVLSWGFADNDERIRALLLSVELPMVPYVRTPRGRGRRSSCTPRVGVAVSSTSGPRIMAPTWDGSWTIRDVEP